MLTTAQLATLKTSILANTATVLINGNATQIKDVPVSPDNCQAIADWYNQTASPDYKVWDTAVALKTLRTATDLSKYTPSDAVPASPSTDMTYQNRALLCQLKQANAFFLIQGEGAIDATPPQLRTSFNDCMTAIPSGSSGANQNAGWGTAASPGAVRLAMQRSATNGEKVFSTQPANSNAAGNVNADGRGVATNPDALAVSGSISGNEVLTALS